MATQHSVLTDPELHEPKGAAAASVNTVYVADGAGSGAWTMPFRRGIWDYDHAGSAVTLTAANTQYELINDGLGSFTNKTYALAGVTDVWDTGTNRFDFTGLKLGDTVDIRVDLNITTTAVSSVVDVVLELGVGGSPYQISWIPKTYFKSAATYTNYVTFNSIYMGDSNTLSNPARLLARSDKAGDSIAINGWYVRVLSS